MTYPGKVKAEERLNQWVSATGLGLDRNAQAPDPENRRWERVWVSHSPEAGPSGKDTRMVVFIPATQASPGQAQRDTGPDRVAPAAMGGQPEEAGGQDGGDEDNELVMEDREKRVERWEQRKDSLFHLFERMERRILLDLEEAGRWI